MCFFRRAIQESNSEASCVERAPAAHSSGAAAPSALRNAFEMLTAGQLAQYLARCTQTRQLGKEFELKIHVETLAKKKRVALVLLLRSKLSYCTTWFRHCFTLVALVVGQALIV